MKWTCYLHLFTDLLQVPDHFILAAVENSAEQLYNLLVIQVVNNFNDTRQQQLNGQVQVTMKAIWKKMQRSLETVKA